MEALRHDLQDLLKIRDEQLEDQRRQIKIHRLEAAEEKAKLREDRWEQENNVNYLT